MRNLVVTLLCLFLPSFAFGGIETNKNALSLIQKVEKKRANLKNRIKSQTLIKVLSSDVRQGESFSIYLQSATEITGTNSLIDLEIDNVPVEVSQPAKGLFIYHSSGKTEVKTHNAVAKLSIEDSAEAKSLRDAISQIDVEIQFLQEQIDEMEPGEEQDALISQRNEKQAIKAQLVAALSSIKAPIGEEAFTFRILAAVGNNPNFFRITGVSPSFGPVGGGTELTVTGQRFPATGLEALLGGVSLPVTFVSSTQVKIMAPNFTSSGGVGMKHLELRLPTADPVKNAIRNNVFYAADISSPVGNVKPVAVAGGAQSVSVGAQVSLDGSASYDSNTGDTITYEWKAVSVPVSSGISTGVVHSTASGFEFTPSKPGSYVWELTVSDGLLSSEPSLTVVTANPPANSAPAPTAGSLFAAPEGTATVQVNHGDVDDYQAHSYQIIQQSSLGTASVSSTGLVSFEAGSTPGTGSIEVLVVDNGSLPLSGSVFIPVTVASGTILVDDLYAQVRARDGFITVALGADTLSTTAPGIKSVVWDFGDGTSGASPNPYENDGYVEHDYLVAGTYTATATMTDSYGNTGSKSFTFSTGTSAMPVPHVVSDVYSGAAPLTVNFDATGSTDDVGINQYRFRWNDGSPDTTNATGLASHTFNEEGDYRVRLRTRDADNNMALAYIDIHVGSSPAPEKSRPMPIINIAAKEVVIGSAHSFSGVNSFDPNPSGAIAAYRWNFGDYQNCDWEDPNPGCMASGSTATHSYTSAFPYWMELEVEGALGGTQSAFAQVLSVNAGHAPRAMPGRNYAEGVAPFTLHVDGTHSFDYDGTIEASLWEYGDENCTEDCSSAGPTGSYTFGDAGNYYVKYFVQDDDENIHSDGFTVMVYPNEEVKKKMQARVKERARASAKTRSSEKDREREKLKNMYAQQCSRGKASACYNAGKLYEEDGNSFAASKFYEKACALGYSEACSTR